MAAVGLRLAAVLCCLLLAGKGAAEQSLPTEWLDGIATNYGGPHDNMDPYSPSFGTSIGACGYGLLDKTKFPYWSVAALSTQNSFHLTGPQGACGECIEIQCIQDGGEFAGRCNKDPNARTVTVQITDVCPECPSYHIDVQALTFNKIAPIASGRINTKYRRVSCVPPTGLTINVDQNYGCGSWLRMTVQKVAGTGSIKQVQVKGTNSNWADMTNKWGASWEMDKMPCPPLDLRVVSTDGSEVTAFSFIDKNGEKGNLPVGVNFAVSKDPGVTAITTLPGMIASDASSAITQATSSISSNFGSSASASAQVTAFDGPNGNNSPPSPSWMISPPPPPASPPPPSGNQSPTVYWGSSPSPPPPSSWSSSSSNPSPPPPPDSSSSSGSSGSSCSDEQPPGTSYSCAQQKQWGNCYASWMTSYSSGAAKIYCGKTCGRC